MTGPVRQSISVGVGSAIGSLVADLIGVTGRAATSEDSILQALAIGVVVGLTWFVMLVVRRKVKPNA